MALTSQQIAAMYSPLAMAMNLDAGRELGADRAQQNANINFDQRIQRQALPITRMLNSDNSINTDEIKNAKPFSSAASMWEELSANMPRNRGIDPVVFQEKYAMGKQMYDMNLANQIASMAETGMTDKEIRGALKQNPELYDYTLNNSIMPRETKGFSLFETVKNVGVPIGVGIGAERAFRRFSPDKPTTAGLKDLRSKGFKVVTKDGQRKIVRMTDKEMYKKPKVAPGQASSAIKEAKEAVRAKKRLRVDAIKESPSLEKALKGNRAAINQVLSKGARPAGRIAQALSGAGKFLRGKGAIGTGVGIGASLLADYLMRQGEE
jgi:hypothetical protein